MLKSPLDSRSNVTHRYKGTLRNGVKNTVATGSPVSLRGLASRKRNELIFLKDECLECFASEENVLL